MSSYTCILKAFLGRTLFLDLRRSCWSGRGLVIEVDGIGRRQVSWVRKKGGVSKIRGMAREVEWECISDASKVLNWAPQGTKQVALRPGLGRGTSPVMGSFYSGPSLFERGESSLAGEGKPAQVLALETCPRLVTSKERRTGELCLWWWPTAPSPPGPAPTSSWSHRERTPGSPLPGQGPMSIRCC